MLNSGIAEIETLTAQAIDEHNITGLAIGLVRDHSVKFIKTYGVRDRETKAPVTIQTLFRLGSITKIFIAYLLMQFVEEGKLSLDDVVATYLPQFSDFDTKNTITFRHLVTHTSGLPMMPPSVELPQDIESIQAIEFPDISVLLSDLAQTAPLFDAGADYAYSNYGIGILGYTLATLANKSYRDLVRERILEPLKLNHTTFDPNQANLDVATGYVMFVEPPVIMPKVDIGGFTPAGQLFSTVADMTEFIRAQWDTSLSLLSPESLRSMQSLSWDRGEQAMSIGWMRTKISDELCYFHGGADPGYVSYLIIEPKRQLGIILMTNTITMPNIIQDLGNALMEVQIKLKEAG